MERIYRSRNGIIEKTRYFVGDNARPRGKKRKGTTSFRKAEENFNLAIRRLARILNNNFEPGDLLIGLSFSPEGLASLEEGMGDTATRAWGSEEERLNALRAQAEKAGKLWLRRIKRKAQGEMPWILVASDMDGDTGEMVRVHLHLVIREAGISWDTLRELWRLGSVDIRELRRQEDYTPLAAYLMRQVRRQPDRKKYACSRGMIQPQTEEREVKTMRRINAPVGATVFEQRYSEEEAGQYIRYKARPREKRGGHKEGLPGAGEVREE